METPSWRVVLLTALASSAIVAALGQLYLLRSGL